MKPALVTVWLLRALQLWNDFLYPFVFLRASQRTLPTGLYVFRGQYLTNWPLLMAAAALVALPMLLIYIFLQRRMIDGLVSGAVKG
jgi:raffinose/stachyose/melibiose transport system permease protein